MPATIFLDKGRMDRIRSCDLLYLGAFGKIQFVLHALLWSCMFAGWLRSPDGYIDSVPS